MYRSRTTLAITLAAAMDRLRPSPPTIARDGAGNPGTGRPSTSRKSGGGRTRPTARRMARWVAQWMSRRSISSTVAHPTPIETSGRPRKRRAHVRRAAWERRFESVKPRNSSTNHGRSTGRTTQAANTGPASGPRPASSTPAGRRRPAARASSSASRVGVIPRPPPARPSPCAGAGSRAWRGGRARGPRPRCGRSRANGAETRVRRRSRTRFVAR